MLSCTDATPPAACGCHARLGRRGLLGLGAALAGLGLAGAARAASGNYDAMLVNCIDPRVTTASWKYMGDLGMRDRYSQFVIAGGPIGAVHPRFAEWHLAYWANLDITLQLHRIERVVALTHRDCGAASVAFGEDAVKTPEAETAAHSLALRAFRASVALRHPRTAVTTGIMALDGTVQIID